MHLEGNILDPEGNILDSFPPSTWQSSTKKHKQQRNAGSRETRLPMYHHSYKHDDLHRQDGGSKGHLKYGEDA